MRKSTTQGRPGTDLVLIDVRASIMGVGPAWSGCVGVGGHFADDPRDDDEQEDHDAAEQHRQTGHPDRAGG